MTYKKAISHLRNEIVNATGALAALPPEAEEISSLKYHIEALEIAVEALGKARWISLSERRPENGEYVLLSFEELDVPDIGKYYVTDGDGAFLFNYEGEELGLQDDLTVNAWMPLPAPYGEE